MKTVVQNNQDKVSFQFGTYTQFGDAPSTTRRAATTGTRFQYWTTDQLSPSMAGERAHGPGRLPGHASGRGLQSWQIIHPQWSTLYFEEDANGAALSTRRSARPPSRACPSSTRAAAVAPSRRRPDDAPEPGVRAADGHERGDLRHRHAARTLLRRVQHGQRRLHVHATRAPGGSGASSGARRRNNIRNALGRDQRPPRPAGRTRAAWRPTGPGACSTATTGTGSGARAASSGPSWSARRTSPTTSSAPAALWNGEVIRVQSDGRVCGMDFPTAADQDEPALAHAAARRDQLRRRPDAARDLQLRRRRLHGNSVSCRGFRSKSSLIPCDLQSPPGAAQFTCVSPYIDHELPVQRAGDPADLTTNGAAYGSANYGVPDGIPDYVEAQDGSWAASYDQPRAEREGRRLDADRQHADRHQGRSPTAPTPA